MSFIDALTECLNKREKGNISRHGSGESYEKSLLDAVGQLLWVPEQKSYVKQKSKRQKTKQLQRLIPSDQIYNAFRYLTCRKSPQLAFRCFQIPTFLSERHRGREMSAPKPYETDDPTPTHNSRLPLST